MGTDIHMAVEVNAYGEEDGWEFLPGPIVDCWSCKGLGIYTEEKNPHYKPELWGRPCDVCTNPVRYGVNRGYVGQPGRIRDSRYGDRNYVVFAALADVRNGAGFAGCDTGDPITPITYPRGVPDDITAETKGALSWDHTQTWLDLSEVMNFDWDQIIVKRGYVNQAEFQEFVSEGRPGSWCGDISGGRIIKVSNAEMAALPPGSDNAYTQVQWEVPLRDYCDGFLERMRLLGQTVGECRTRLVFDFDS